jgi:hypothetical protein
MASERGALSGNTNEAYGKEGREKLGRKPRN